MDVKSGFCSFERLDWIPGARNIPFCSCSKLKWGAVFFACNIAAKGLIWPLGIPAVLVGIKDEFESDFISENEN